MANVSISSAKQAAFLVNSPTFQGYPALRAGRRRQWRRGPLGTRLAGRRAEGHAPSVARPGPGVSRAVTAYRLAARLPRVITSDKRVLCQPCGLILLGFFDTLRTPPKTPGNRPLQAGQLAALEEGINALDVALYGRYGPYPGAVLGPFRRSLSHVSEYRSLKTYSS